MWITYVSGIGYIVCSMLLADWLGVLYMSSALTGVYFISKYLKDHKRDQKGGYYDQIQG